MNEIVFILEYDTERAAEGIGPARALFVEQSRGFRPFDRFGNAWKLGERLAPQTPDRGDDRARVGYSIQ